MNIESHRVVGTVVMTSEGMMKVEDDQGVRRTVHPTSSTADTGGGQAATASDLVKGASGTDEGDKASGGGTAVGARERRPRIPHSPGSSRARSS